jgi:hypothetical protein
MKVLMLAKVGEKQHTQLKSAFSLDRWIFWTKYCTTELFHHREKRI